MMILIEKEKDKFIVYDVVENEKEIWAYRLDEISKIPSDRQIYECKERGVSEHIFEKRESCIGNYSLNELMNQRQYDNGSWINGKLIMERRMYPQAITNDMKAKLIDNYVKGLYSSFPVFMVVSHDLRYFMPTREKGKDYYDKWIMQGIMEITEPLFVLQMIGQGKFNYERKNMPPLSELFCIKNVSEIDDVYGVNDIAKTNYTYDEVMKKVDEHSKVLKLIKK